MGYSQIHTEFDPNSRRSGISHIVARLISDVANPLLLPPLVILGLACLLSLPARQTVLISTIALVGYTLIPFGITLWMLNKGQIHSLDIPIRENREQLFLYAMISTTVGSVVLLSLALYMQLNRILVEATLVFLMNPLLGYYINRRFKISIHTGSLATAGALFLVAFLRMPDLYVSAGAIALVVLLVLLPAMIWSRLRLRIHSYPELFGGLLAGLLFSSLGIGLMQMIW